MTVDGQPEISKPRAAFHARWTSSGPLTLPEVSGNRGGHIVLGDAARQILHFGRRKTAVAETASALSASANRLPALPALRLAGLLEDGANRALAKWSRQVTEHGIRFLCVGVSGGEEGVRHGPIGNLRVPITALFLDIGGVLLSNGWDHHARRRAAKKFKLEWAEMEERHRLTFETHEEGKLTFEEYLGRVVFYQKRPFTRAQFRRFMFAQSKPYPEMIELVAQLKARYGLKIAVVSNEAREVNGYRIRKFKLGGLVDSFISSCFVHVRKPDADIFRLALDIAQVPARQVVYVENTPMFVQIAEGLGIRSILHTDYASTCAQLASFGLKKEGATWKPLNHAS